MTHVIGVPFVFCLEPADQLNGIYLPALKTQHLYYRPTVSLKIVAVVGIYDVA